MTNNVVPFTRPEVTEYSPYTRPAVKAAMLALDPANGGNLGDLQAVAEICLDILMSCASEHIEEYKTEDPEFSQGAAEDLCRLKVANDLLEGCAYIHMNDPDVDEEAV